MSTRSCIGVQKEYGRIDCIYCHWDGYYDHNGVILEKNYNSTEEAVRLVSHGDLSSLGETFGDCIFYHRDRGEPFEQVKPLTVGGIEDFFYHASQNCGAVWSYLWTGSQWNTYLNRDRYYPGEEYE